MKIFITGHIQIGKSTCIQRLIDTYNIPVCGFQTKPLFDEHHRRIGFFMHSLVALQQNDVRFSIQHPTYSEVIDNVFNQFGCEVLRKSSQLKDHVLILDEIGILEKDEQDYMALLKEVIHTHPHVLGVIKKKEAAHLTEIQKMDGVQLMDMDEVPFEEIYRHLSETWERILLKL